MKSWELSRYRKELDEAKIIYECYDKPISQKYPKMLASKDGSSMIFKTDESTFFKRKSGDGNMTHDQDFVSQHHFYYDELLGTFDDLAEVLCYKLAKNMGTTFKTDNEGNVVEVPLIDCAEYQLATYTNKQGVDYHGCISKSITPNGEVLIKGIDILNRLGLEGKPENSLPNYKKALEIFSNQSECVLDKNIERDLVVNSYFQYKVGNSDNHSSNITFIQSRQPDGTLMLKVSPIIDNGGAWELMRAYAIYDSNNNFCCSHNDYCQQNRSSTQLNPEGEPKVVFNTYPYRSVAFHLDAGNLNNCQKTLNGEDRSYEYDLAAYALSNPEIYQSIYEIESRFDIERTLSEIETEYRLRWPDGLKDFIRATTECKTNEISAIMAKYYCHTAYQKCFGEVNAENPTELYSVFQEEMSKLPLQESASGYMEEFMKIAQQNQIQVDENLLNNLNFLPSQDDCQSSSYEEN